MSQTSRPVIQVVTPEPVVEGAGVHLRRSLGTRSLDHLDPFLLLDHFESVKPADYVQHPWRGGQVAQAHRVCGVTSAHQL